MLNIRYAKIITIVKKKHRKNTNQTYRKHTKHTQNTLLKNIKT